MKHRHQRVRTQRVWQCVHKNKMTIKPTLRGNKQKTSNIITNQENDTD